jgi:multiple sugar transport system permease protein
MTGFFVICLSRVPRRLVESARLEGASTLYRAVRVEIPYIAPYIAIAFLIRWADTFRLFDAPWSLFRDSPVISFFSTRAFSSAIITRDFASCLAICGAALLVSLPAFLFGARFVHRIISRGLHED